MYPDEAGMGSVGVGLAAKVVKRVQMVIVNCIEEFDDRVYRLWYNKENCLVIYRSRGANSWPKEPSQEDWSELMKHGESGHHNPKSPSVLESKFLESVIK